MDVSGSDGSLHGTQGLLVHDSVEPVVGVGGVLHDASRAVGFHQRVRALYHVARARLLLALGVACKENGVRF